MAEYKPIPIKFENRGVVQSKDIDNLAAGEYYELQNATSMQGGAIRSRLGATRFSGAIGSVVHTIEGFSVGSANSQKYLYVGEGQTVNRLRLDAPGSATTVKSGLPAWGARWSGTKFNIGKSGRPHFFVAASEMLKDSAVTAAGAATTAMQAWGIVPPAAAPIPALSAELSVSIFSGSTEITWNSDEGQRWKGSIGLDSPITITASPVNLSQFSSTVKSGNENDGYDSEDYIELTLSMLNPERFSLFVLEFDASAVANTWADSYKADIIPNQLTGAISRSTSPLQLYDERRQFTGSGVLGERVDQYDQYGTQPIEMPPSRSSDSGSAADVVIRIPKNQFVKVGAAGTTGKTWANIKYARLWAKSSNLDAAVSITMKSVRLVGGSGPNNVDGALAPYEYLYTYRNDATGHESNPCPLAAPRNYIKNVQRRAIAVTGLKASSDTQVTSIGVYRRGGSMGLDFRLVGYAPNSNGDFIDNRSDEDLQFSPLLEFDNDPPVTSKLSTAFSGTFTGNTAIGSQNVSITVSQPSGIACDQFLTVGTRLLVLDGEKTEFIQVTAVSGNTVTAFFQETHDGTVQVRTDSAIGVPCDVSARVGDCILLAGDRNNPGTLYKSKAGRPESFPLQTEATGAVHQVIVGGSANPILGITEYGGMPVALNRYGISVVPIINDGFTTPQDTAATNGLLCKQAWCRGGNRIFFLSDDGVYAWAGGTSDKISGAIDWFFRDQVVNGRYPLDKTEDGLLYAKMAFHQDKVLLACRGTDGYHVIWAYTIPSEAHQGGWELYTPSYEANDLAGWTAVTSFDSNLFTGRFLQTGASTTGYVYREMQGSSDNGVSFPFVVHTGFFNFGEPILQKQFGDIVLELNAPTDVAVKVYYDRSTSASETFTIPGASGWRRFPLPFNSGSAREASCIGFRFEGTSSGTGPVILYSMTFNVLSLASIQRGRASDWEDGGYPHDKRLDQLVIDYDTGGTTVTLNMDTISGILGNSISTGVSTFTLTGTGRSQATLPIKRASDSDWVVCKAWRLRPTTTSADFKIFSADITFERYPPDVTLFTDPNEYGSPYDKHFQQLLLDVDTGGLPATVDVYIDNASTPSQSLTITSTAKTRNQNPVLTTGLVGKKAYLKITPHSSGKFQLFSHNFVTLPADKGPVFHTYDWSDQGTPLDKQFRTAFIEYEVASPVTMIFEGITGIGGNQSASILKTISLTSTIRKREQFDFADASVAKLIRLLPQNSTDPASTVKIYEVKYDFEVLPPDIVRWTMPDDYGTPYDKHFQQLLLDIDTGGIPASVAVYIDGVLIQTFVNIVTTFNARNVNLTMLAGATGKKAKLQLTPGTGGKTQLFSHNFIAVPADKGPVLHSYDWDDYGSPNDKMLRSVFIEYEVQLPVTMLLEGIVGLSGSQSVSTISAFTLSGSGRKRESFPIPDGTVAKMFRVRPSTTADPESTAKIYAVKYDAELLPQDIVLWTMPSDYGTPYDKHFQQLLLDIDTGGVSASVAVYVDNALVHTFTGVSTTFNARNVNLTMPAGISGKKAKLRLTPGTNGKTQLYGHDFITVPADKGPVLHSYDWDNLGTPTDKILHSVFMEYEVQLPVVMLVEGVSGLTGNQSVSTITTFTLNPSGRKQEEFSLPDGTIVKMVRIRPSTTADPESTAKIYKVEFKKEVLPPDFVRFTERSDLGYPCEKVFRSVTVDMDTGGKEATIEVEIDGVVTSTFYMATTRNNKTRTFSFLSDTDNTYTMGRQVRLLTSVASGGKTQLYNYNFDFTREPCPATFWDSFEQFFGSNGFKYMKQAWVEYRSTGQITVRFYRDGGQLFYEKTLPQQTQRGVQRFFLPESNTDIVNKSHSYRITIEAEPTTHFYLYRDSSRIETMLLSGDTRACYNQHYLYQEMPIQK